jgi:hypothetical protein
VLRARAASGHGRPRCNPARVILWRPR